MKIIGITGGIGSGKSTVAQFLAELGAVIVDVDKVGHEALNHDNEVRQRLERVFGQQIVGADGEIDRAKLGEIVFGNSEARVRLNQIIHPRMYDMTKAQLEEYRRQGVGVVVVDAPLLIEAGWTSLVDEVWVTIASEATVLKRLGKRMGLTAQESKARIQAQLSLEERIEHADVVIDTDCGLAELKAKVAELEQRLTG